MLHFDRSTVKHALQKDCHQWLSRTFRFRPGLCSGTRWGADNAHPDPLAGLMKGTLLLRGRGRESFPGSALETHAEPDDKCNRSCYIKVKKAKVKVMKSAYRYPPMCDIEAYNSKIKGFREIKFYTTIFHNTLNNHVILRSEVELKKKHLIYGHCAVVADSVMPSTDRLYDCDL